MDAIQQMKFSTVIAPIGEEQFFKVYWERCFLHVSRGDPQYFQSLVSIEDIDKEIARADTRFPDIRAARADEDLPKEEYVRDNGRIDAIRLYQRFEEGATIILNQAHRRIPALATFCRSLEERFSFPFQTNLYLTPQDAQGFKLHYDTHDVFALQVVGSKRWNICNSAIELPLRGQDFDPEVDYERGETVTFVSAPGDTVYVPRGILHQAVSTNDVSLHVTVGALTTRWAEFLVEALAATCLKNPQFRRSLPVGFARPDYNLAKLEQEFRSLLNTALGRIEFGETLDYFIETFVASRAAPVSGQLGAMIGVKTLTPETLLQRRPGVAYRLAAGSETCTLYYAGRAIHFPAYCMNVLERALDGGPINAHKLSGDLDEAGCLVLLQRLLKEGLLDQI